jgi:hypothetical protein
MAQPTRKEILLLQNPSFSYKYHNLTYYQKANNSISFIFASLKQIKNMKSIFGLLFISCLLSVSAIASIDPSLRITPANANTFNITYKKADAEIGSVKITILDSASHVVFTEVISNVASFVRPYDFSKLNKGTYTIIAADKNGQQIEKINYSFKKTESFISVSKLTNDENSYALNVTNNGKETISVRILDSNDVVMHEELHEMVGSFGLVYDMCRIKSESFTFEITTSNGYTKTVSFN